MKKIIMLLFMLFILSGCSSLLESERLVIIKAYEKNPAYELSENAKDGSTGIEISNYSSLKTAIKWLVENHFETGELIFSNYDGDVLEDLSRACEDVKSNTAIGAYSVEYTSYMPRQIISYYRADLTITYKRTRQETDAVISVGGGVADFPAAIGEMLLNSDTYAAFRMISTSFTAPEAEDFVKNAYLDNVLDCPVMPSVIVNIYPDGGAEKIIEIMLDYGYTKENLDILREELKAGLTGLGGLPEESDIALAVIETAERLAEICELYSGQLPGSGSTDFEADVIPPLNTAVSALSRGVADSEGFAMAYCAALRSFNIECKVVSGSLDREAHYWNIVRIDDHYYHVDASMINAEGPEITCLNRDADMWSRYFWDGESYPICDGPLTYYGLRPDSETAALSTKAE